MYPASILIVEDNCIVAQDLAAFISSLGFDVCAVCHTAEQASRAVTQVRPDLILMDIELDGAFAGVELAAKLGQQTGAAVMYLSGHSEHEVLMRAGDSRAEGFILKPYDPRQLAISLHMTLSRRSRDAAAAGTPPGATQPLDTGHEFSSIIGSSAVMTSLLEAISLVAPTDVGVLITGENGTGKELVAEAIHKLSRRSSRAFVALNCSAVPAQLLESALFGHARGAFTGAHREQEGFLERAEGGTLFLDEIGDISQEIQVKLLRLLQSQQYHRVGDTTLRRANVRIITATNRELHELVASGKIREDFFYRINVFPLEVPPLRERGDDVCEIAEHFIADFNQAFRKNINGFSSTARAALRAFDWPGNVRQLENAIKRAFVVAKGELIDLHDLPPELSAQRPVSYATKGSVPPSLTRASESQDSAERERILAALAQTGGHKGKAAMLLGYSRITLWKKLTKLGIATVAVHTSSSSEGQLTSP